MWGGLIMCGRLCPDIAIAKILGYEELANKLTLHADESILPPENPEADSRFHPADGWTQVFGEPGDFNQTWVRNLPEGKYPPAGA